MWKRRIRRLAAALLPLLLSGCMLTASVEELYVLPQLPVEYQALSAQIEAILAGGAEYAAPTAGTNLQSVQLVDLDGNGEEEAVAFFRSSGEEKPLKIYIFRATEETYEQAAIIEGSGTAIHSVRYVDMDMDGVRELIVSWRVSAEVQTVGVFALKDLKPVPLMSSPHARYEVMDLDDDGVRELLVLRSDGSGSGGSAADYYDWSDEALLLQSTARLSMTVAELQWLQTGKLRSGETAAFITGVVTGAEETARAITDILVYKHPDLSNIVLGSDTGVSTEIFRYLTLQSTDIDGDGVTELPMPAQLPGEVREGQDPYWKIYWRSYDAAGNARQQTITYHNLADSWYLTIPEGWDSHFTVTQTNLSATEHATTFYSVSGSRVGEELLTIYTLTGSDREVQAARSGRTILRRQPNAIYAVSFAEGYDTWRYAVAAETLAERFSVIVAQWNTGES